MKNMLAIVALMFPTQVFAEPINLLPKLAQNLPIEEQEQADSQKSIGTWSTVDGCKMMESAENNGKTPLPKNFEMLSFLTSDGISGHEWQCEFLQSWSDKQGQMVILSSCGGEGEMWPETFSLNYSNDQGFVVTYRDGAELRTYIYDHQCKK